jgi:Xaa-Pro dipeptidase
MSFTLDEFSSRLTNLQQLLTKHEVDLAVLNLNPDLYYFTGSIQPMYLLAPATGQPVVLARKSEERIRTEVIGLPLEMFRNTKDLVRIVGQYGFGAAKRVGFTLENTAYATVNRWLLFFEGAIPVDISNEMRYLRMVKSETELAIIRTAGRIIAGIPAKVKTDFQPGMTELELSAALENYLRLNGHGGLLRCRREGIEMGNGVCSAGPNTLAGTKFDGVCAGTGLTAANPYGAGDRPILQNQPVILDYAFNYQGYHLDQTRMFCWGTVPPEVMKAFQTMLEVEQTLMEELKPGKLWSELYELAVKLATDLGYGAEFMGVGPEKVRFVGHGVGLELDEPPYLAPRMDFPVVPGMVIALEPKVALPGIGVIGNEDSVLVTEAGCECLTVAPPEMIVVEDCHGDGSPDNNSQGGVLNPEVVRMPRHV